MTVVGSAIQSGSTFVPVTLKVGAGSQWYEPFGTYGSPDTGKVTLHAHQTIFLFELGTTSLASAAADFQDLIVLVNLANRAATPGSD